MKLNNVGRFSNINDYAKDKLSRFSKEEKTFEKLFEYMFSEGDNVMTEVSDGFRIKKTTYAECKQKIISIAGSFKRALKSQGDKGIVGLYMSNGIEWIQAFWAILMAGYSPLLINARLGDQVIEETLKNYGVLAVVSDSKEFGVKTFNVAELFNGNESIDKDSKWGEEVLFMSSGTTGNLKLCAYTAENFYYQICDSVNIIEVCPQMKEHYDGELKQLALLPFYHVFGFIAVYLWFGFFSRTFVFMKDLSAKTLLNTVKRHKVTHIFAVPLIWETIHKEALKGVRARGEKTYNKFNKALAFVNKRQKLGSFVSKKAFKEIRDNLFGDSIRFLISGGSGVSLDTLAFFNGIGYHMANGYGMTEVGITSVEISLLRKVRNLGSIGNPFRCTEYKVSENGELLIKGKTMASRVLLGDGQVVTDFDQWFNSHDLVEKRDGGYYIMGRKDDLVVCEDGENLNPEIIENQLKIDKADRVCLFANAKAPTLLISVKGCYTLDDVKAVYEQATEQLVSLKLNGQIKKVVLTTDKLLKDGEFKVSRAKTAKRYALGEYDIIKLDGECSQNNSLLNALENQVAECFKQALQREEDVELNADFFLDLGGSSLDYFALLDILKTKFGINPEVFTASKTTTVKNFADIIKGKKV